MGRPRKNIGEASAEIVHKVHLEEQPDELPVNEQVVVTSHIPETRKVVFHNYRDPGQPLDFHYYSGTHPLKMYTLYHDRVHELPVEVIEHLESCGQNLYDQRYNTDMKASETYVKGKSFYFQFKTAPRQRASA